MLPQRAITAGMPKLSQYVCDCMSAQVFDTP